MMEIICDRIFEFGITTSLVFSVSLKFVVGGKTKNSSSAELTYSVIMGIPQNATGTSAVLLVSLNDHSTTNECEPHRKCHSRVVPPTRTICMFTGHISPHISPQVERNECSSLGKNSACRVFMPTRIPSNTDIAGLPFPSILRRAFCAD
jgi:hypothetical protein